MRRARDRARRAAQTAEERDAGLRQIRDNRRQSLATESEEERAVRLQQMSANQCHRLATETEEERAARLRVGRPGVLIDKFRMQMYSTMTYSHTYMYTYCILCGI